MPSLGLAPFLPIPTDGSAVNADSWRLAGVDDAGVIRGWDYSMPLSFSRTLRLVPSAIRTATGLERGTVLRAAVAWVTRAGVTLGGVAVSQDFSLSGDAEIAVDLSFPLRSTTLAQTLALDTVIVLAVPATDSAPTAAYVPGSKLWDDRVTFILEGTSPRLPIAAADFGRHPSRQADASWFVWTSNDWLHLHPSAGISVFVNRAKRELVAALGARRPDPIARLLQSTFRQDVGRILMDRCLDEPEFTDATDLQPGSAGYSLRATFRQLFPGRTIEAIRSMRRDEPAAYEREQQAHHRFLEGLGE